MGGKKIVWIGWALSALVSVLFLMGVVMMATHNPQVTEGFTKYGFAPNLITTIGVIEAMCLLLYWIPATSVLGAVLLTGYLGGAVCTHMRAGEPYFLPIIVGVVVWAGLYLREKRLHVLLPLRK